MLWNLAFECVFGRGVEAMPVRVRLVSGMEGVTARQGGQGRWCRARGVAARVRHTRQLTRMARPESTISTIS